MSNYGFVYVMSNPCMPNIYKIGYTDRSPMQRLEELSNSTSIPIPFELVFYGECPSPREVEIEIHGDFDKYRISPNREFFKFSQEFLIKQVCISISEFCINNTECEAYHMIVYNLKNQDEEDKNEVV